MHHTEIALSRGGQHHRNKPLKGVNITGISTKVYDGELTETKFRETCRKFLLEDILERKGIHYVVKPTVLAIDLAADWLINTDSDKIIQIIGDLKQVNLAEKFMARLKDLDQIDKAKDIVATLWGPGKPFSTAEVLNTSWGSMLFRYVVEVNPIATASAIEVTFGSLSVEDLRKIDEGRRNLVWALEKLVFRKETFNRAAKVLYSFAAAENEQWANNSVNQFRQLFQVHLSGTEADLNQRIRVIEWGLAKNEDAFTEVAILAMGRGLRFDDFSRGGGAENQGSGPPLKDYIPNTWTEIFEYWTNFLNKLTELACLKNANASLAREKIANAIRTLIREGQVELVEDSVNRIVQRHKSMWPEALNALQMTVSFEEGLPAEVLEKINSLTKVLTPTDLKNQLILKVSKPVWDSYEKDSDGNYIDKPCLNAKAFAKKVVHDNLNWTDYLEALLQGEQIQTFNFGKQVGELIKNTEDIISKSLKILRRISSENQNVELIGGLLAGTKNKIIFERVINVIIKDPFVRHHAFSLTRANNPTYNDIKKLFRLIDKYKFPINAFLIFQFGRSLNLLTNEQVRSLCHKIGQHSDIGKLVSLAIFYRYCYDDKRKWDKNKKFLKTLISSDNLLLVSNNSPGTDFHPWSESVLRLLSENKYPGFAVSIAQQILEACSKSFSSYPLENRVFNVLRLLLAKYFPTTWRILSPAFLGESLIYDNLKGLLGSRNGWLGNDCLLFNDDERNNVILKWCDKNPGLAPERIAKMMPIEKKMEGKVMWHPLAKTLIDRFGATEEVLESISSSMRSFGMSGSAIPYYRSRKQLLQEMVNHQIPGVRDWAEKMLEETEKEILAERLEEESRFI